MITKTKEQIENLIEPHFLEDLVEDNYEIISINSKDLLVWSRFDLAFKILYLEMKDYRLDFSKEIYTEHIRAFSLGEFTEPGSKNKSSIKHFIDEFEVTFNDIRDNGFDSNKTLIPISKNGSIANGSHRVASSIILRKNVECIKINATDQIYDYNFFYERNVSSNILDIVASKFIEHSDNIHIAFIWPSAKGHDSEISKLVPNVVYKKMIKLTPVGAVNLTCQLYHDEEWLGSSVDNYAGARSKVNHCFNSFDFFQIIVFQSNSLKNVIKIKKKIRALFQLGKHSVHITDSKDEAKKIGRLIFNSNSLHFLNYSRPIKCQSVAKNINSLNAFVESNGIERKSFLVDSSFTLSLYGLREARDIDYLIETNNCINYKFDNISSHDSELIYHQESKNNLIFNPQFYFYYNGMKFISFQQLYRMKSNRAEQKDINDCAMMEALIEDKIIRRKIVELKQIIFYQKLKVGKQLLVTQRVASFLKFFKLYHLSRSCYRFGRRLISPKSNRG